MSDVIDVNLALEELNGVLQRGKLIARSGSKVAEEVLRKELVDAKMKFMNDLISVLAEGGDVPCVQIVSVDGSE